jgi:hypothetical protein
MKKVICLAIFVALLFTGCVSIKVVAPPNQNIQLLSETQPTSFRMTKRAIFLIGGLIPIANTSTDDMLAKYDLKNVKITTEFDIIDFIISGITSGLVVTKSVIIEGNAK